FNLVSGSAFISLARSVMYCGYLSCSNTTSPCIFLSSPTGIKSYFIVRPHNVPLSPYILNAHGYSGSAGVPQLLCCQTQFSPSYSKTAFCVSAILLLPVLST